MTDLRQRLLAAVLASPDDPQPLLVYADALQEAGDPRGEFISLQVKADALPEDDPARVKLERAAAKIEKANRRTWLDGLPMVRQGTFRRGMLHAIVATADPFFEGVAQLLAREPVRGIKLTKFKPRSHLKRLAELLRDRAFESLDLSQCRLDAAQVEALFERADTSRLRHLRLVDDPIGAQGARAIASRPLGQLEVLELGGSDSGRPGDDALRAFLESSSLRRLRVLELSYFGITAAGARELAASPVMESVEVLNLQSNGFGDEGVAALAASPVLRRLRQLELGHSLMTDVGARALLGSPVLATIRPPPGRAWALLIWDNSYHYISPETRAALDARLGPGVIVW
jgi:uncharacterized protein (TIGR02996 family)